MIAGEGRDQQDGAPGSCGLGESTLKGPMPCNLGLSSCCRRTEGEEGRQERNKEDRSRHDSPSRAEKEYRAQFTLPGVAGTGECRG